MRNTESILRRGLENQGDDLTFTLDPAFQGLPDTAHGGSVLAAFHLLAPDGQAGEVHGRYLKRVPLGVPLSLKLARDAQALHCQLLDTSNTTLVEGQVAGVETGPRADGVDPLRPPADPYWLPVSRTCFACGTDNALGLRVRLGYDEQTVGGTWQPNDGLVSASGTLAPIALTTLLDETAFWLAALASGESGMTTDLAVTLHRPVPFGPPITIAGARERVRQRRDDPRYWDTAVTALDANGQVVAEARITFVAVRGAARRLAAWLGAVNPPGVVQRVFPAYAR